MLPQSVQVWRFLGAVLMCRCRGQAFGIEAQPYHDPPAYGRCSGATDMEITLQEILKLKKELYSIISHHSGQPFDKVEADFDRDYWMTSQEAKDYGMVDEILLGKNQAK